MTRVSEDVYICKLEEKIGFFSFLPVEVVD